MKRRASCRSSVARLALTLTLTPTLTLTLTLTLILTLTLTLTRYAHPLPDGVSNPWEAGAEGDARSPGVVELAGSPTNGFVGYKLHNTPAAAQQRKAAPLCHGGIAAAMMSAIHRCLRRFQGSR